MQFLYSSRKTWRQIQFISRASISWLLPFMSHNMLLLYSSSFECNEPALRSRSAGRSIGDGTEADPFVSIAASQDPCCNARQARRRHQRLSQ